MDQSSRTEWVVQFKEEHWTSWATNTYAYQSLESAKESIERDIADAKEQYTEGMRYRIARREIVETIIEVDGRAWHVG